MYIGTNMTTVDLSKPGITKLITEQIKIDIDKASLLFNDGHRSHLGASLIGHNCNRYLWYVFRWVQAETFEPRMLRLFNRGHREEAAFISLLENAGFKVDYENREGFAYHMESDSYCILAEGDIGDGLAERVTEYDSNYSMHVARAKADGLEFPQFRISDCKGHFGGSLDGIIQLPESYGIDKKFLCEFKTNGTGSAFNSLKASGVKMEKPQHWAQQCVYGYKKELSHSLYMNVNKNDDSLHIEFVELDANYGKQLIQKAEAIIFSQTPPNKYSLNPTIRECVYCNKKDICHNEKPAEVNCRSCKHAMPVDNAEWACGFYGNSIIPKDFIKQGCPNWVDITKG